MTQTTPITVAYGDGIGPEIMTATLRILQAAGARLDIETIQIGESVYKRGIETGIEPSAWESLRRTKVFLKAPITTPQGGGYKSLNVTVRTSLGLYANVRPCVAYAPFVKTLHPGMNVVVIRENEEDLYTGIEYRQTEEVFQSLKLISRPGCERIVRYAFEYAKNHHRKKVTCFTKDNIMKMSDGLFHKVFDEIAKEYPEIQNEHLIVDIGAARLADTPERFEVVVMPNLYGDILSDVAAQIAGSVGLAGSANIGTQAAMFEAIHGSAPSRAGQDVANPSGLLLAGVMMLVHIGQAEAATRVHNAWLCTLEDGIHTYDIYTEGKSTKKVGTQSFAQAVIERLGYEPKTLPAVYYSVQKESMQKLDHWATVQPPSHRPKAKKSLVGVDVFLDWNQGTKEMLGEKLRSIKTSMLSLQMITNRGVQVFPKGLPETLCTDHWRCRFLSNAQEKELPSQEIVTLLQEVYRQGFDVVQTESLYSFDGVLGFSTGQGD